MSVEYNELPESSVQVAIGVLKAAKAWYDEIVEDHEEDDGAQEDADAFSNTKRAVEILEYDAHTGLFQPSDERVRDMIDVKALLIVRIESYIRSMPAVDMHIKRLEEKLTIDNLKHLRNVELLDAYRIYVRAELAQWVSEHTRLQVYATV